MTTFLRHTVATIAYRFQKSVYQVDEDFGDLTLGHGSRTPIEIIHHMYKVLQAARNVLRNHHAQREQAEILDLRAEIDRFNDGLIDLDIDLTHKEIRREMGYRILQGPLADILTHIGQISMLRRIAGYPVKREDFSAAEIEVGDLNYF